MSSAIIEVTDVEKSFEVGTQVVKVLHQVTVEIAMGDFVIIVGPSGCGKSTLLHIILGLEKPSTGEVTFLGEKIYQNTTEDFRSDFRKKHIGMVYQQSNWVKSMSVAENVAFPMLLLGMDKIAAHERAVQLLAKLKMQEWADYMPSELSGGQQQRVSLARALANNPEIIIADEPTGNLDYQTGQEVMQLLQELNTKEKKTIVMVTHDLEYLKYANRAIKMFDGRVEATYTENQIVDLINSSHQKRGLAVAEQVAQSSSIEVDSQKPTLKVFEKLDDEEPVVPVKVQIESIENTISLKKKRKTTEVRRPKSKKPLK